jgi:putative inorganic carbon (HCO3(-)) transporter
LAQAPRHLLSVLSPCERVSQWVPGSPHGQDHLGSLVVFAQGGGQGYSPMSSRGPMSSVYLTTGLWMQPRRAVRSADVGSMSSPEHLVIATSENASKTALLDDLLEIGWLLVAILVPMGINLWARQPFDPPKAAILRSLVWVMAGVWLIRGTYGRSPVRCDLSGNPLLWPTLGVAAAQVLATIFAVDRRLSLWGSYERSSGLLTQLSYPLLFLAVADRLRTVDQSRRLVTAMVATAVPLIGLALLQATGWNPAGLISDARSSVYATLGRPNFLGAYLAMLLPLTLSMTAGAQKRWQQLAAGLLALGEATVVALTMARGAWVAAAVASGAFCWYLLWPRLVPWQRRAVVILGLMCFAASMAGAYWLTDQGGSVAARLTIWRASLELIVDRPVLGYGPDGMGLVFPRVYPPQLVYYQGRGLIVDRAHNLFLDWTLTTGVLGLAAELALLTTYFAAGWRAVQKTLGAETRLLLVACLTAVAGHTIGNLVSFNVTATATANWLLMALTVALSAPERSGGSDEAAHRSTWQSHRWPALWLRLAIVATVGVAVAHANIRPSVADVAGRIFERRSAAGDWPGAIKASSRAVALWPTEPAHHLSLSWAHLQQAQVSGGDPLPSLRQAEAQLLAARDLRPKDFRIWSALGELYGKWGNRWDKARLLMAHKAYGMATSLAPNLATLYAAWGVVYLEGGHSSQASTLFRRAVDLDATDGYSFAHLGDCELDLGHLDAALAAYQEAERWEPDLSFVHLGLARCYWRLGHWNAAALALDRASQLDPDSDDVRDLRQLIGVHQ